MHILARLQAAGHSRSRRVLAVSSPLFCALLLAFVGASRASPSPNTTTWANVTSVSALGPPGAPTTASLLFAIVSNWQFNVTGTYFPPVQNSNYLALRAWGRTHAERCVDRAVPSLQRCSTPRALRRRWTPTRCSSSSTRRRRCWATATGQPQRACPSPPAPRWRCAPHARHPAHVRHGADLNPRSRAARSRCALLRSPARPSRTCRAPAGTSPPSATPPATPTPPTG